VIVTAADGFLKRRVVTDGTGEYRIDDMPPGSYRLGIDPDTIPPNYVGDAAPVDVVVKPTSTVVLDVPVRALGSVAGHVLVNVPTTIDPNGERTLEPVSGVTVVAGQSESTTDSAGRFMLRDLPAGDLEVTLRPRKPLPPTKIAPTGTMRLPKDAVQIEGAVIGIHRPELLQYLKNEPAEPANEPAVPGKIAKTATASTAAKTADLLNEPTAPQTKTVALAAGAGAKAKRSSASRSRSEMGLAAVYSDALNGRTTASGRTYDPTQLTAAHKSLPFGTRVRVTNAGNGKSVELVITDRGPVRKGRILNLSGAAAARLGIRATAMRHVSLEVVALGNGR
jgi:rare lipoprotein A